MSPERISDSLFPSLYKNTSLIYNFTFILFLWICIYLKNVFQWNTIAFLHKEFKKKKKHIIPNSFKTILLVCKNLVGVFACFCNCACWNLIIKLSNKISKNGIVKYMWAILLLFSPEYLFSLYLFSWGGKNEEEACKSICVGCTLTEVMRRAASLIIKHN